MEKTEDLRIREKKKRDVFASGRLFYPFILGIITIMLFANTFGGEFVFDDSKVVVNNPEIRYWHFWDLWELFGQSRNVRTLSLMIDYHFFGDSAQGYHLQNVFWHLLSVLLLYFLFLRLSGERFYSFLGALFFAVHPIHVEAVANIANRKDSLCMAFSLMSFLSYLKFLECRTSRRWGWLPFSFASFFMAINSKQIAVILPLSFVVYEYLFLQKEERFLAKRKSVLITTGIIGSAMSFWYVFNYLEPIKGGFIGESNKYTIVINFAIVFLKNIFLLIFPADLAPEHVVSLKSSLLNVAIIFSWISIVLISFYTLFLFKKKEKMLSFGILWLFIHYIPVSNIVPNAYFIADRYLYIPSAGFCMVLAFADKNLFDKLCYIKGRRFALYITTVPVIVLLAGYAFKTVSYNAAWRDNFSIWNHELKIYPDSARGYHFRGSAYSKAGNFEQALKDYNRSIELAPYYAEFYNNRGNFYAKFAEFSEAMKDYNMAVSLDSDYEEAYYNRGITFGKLGFHKKAIADFDMAIKINPKYTAAYKDRGIAYGSLEDYDSALADFNKAIEIDTEYFEVYNSRGIVYYRLGKYEDALTDFKKVVHIDPKNEKAYYNMELCYSRLGVKNKAKAANTGPKRANK